MPAITKQGRFTNRPYNILLLFPILLTSYFLLHTSSTHAQTNSNGIINVYDIADKEAQDGDILVTTDKGIVRSGKPYDSQLFGVIQSKPLAVFRRVDNTGTPVDRNGNSQVNVTTFNGPINVGDYITSSEIPGKGQKATASGYVIGIALSALGADAQTISYQNKQVTSGTVSVALNIQYAGPSTPGSGSQLLSSFNAALFKNVQDPDKFAQVMRYILAAIVVLASLGVGFFTFSRSIPKGVEAIGRNPLAEKAILFGIVLNIIFTVLVAGVGIVVAAFILRL